MAYSSCPKCDNHSFEMAEMEPRGSMIKVMAIQCSSCGAVVGVTDYYDTGSIIVRIENILKAIAQKLGIYIR